MPTAAPTWPDDRPELLPFLPLVYAAWADGVLSAPEVEAIRARVARQVWLDDDAKDALAGWLDPAHPPSATALVGLRDRLRSVGVGAAGETHRTLVELGLDLARAQGGADEAWSTPEARSALEEMERDLGVVPEEVVRRVVGDASAAAAPQLPPLDDLAEFLQRPRPELRRRVLDLLATEPFQFGPDVPRPERRERVLELIRVLAREGLGSLGYPTSFGGGGDPGGALTVFETLGLGDSSVLVKFGVQFGLFGGSILNLGTKHHHERYLPDVASLALPGCYAMTETGHGSNVRDCETIARYDQHSAEFTIDTPHLGARKDWIGNAAQHGRMATVFARLVVGGEDHGVHALLVPIRGVDGKTLPGVEIEDRGAKVGLEGVDNGLIFFRSVRVPRENLLDRFATVDEQGRYASPIPSSDRRFFTMLGTLVAGRISIAAASVSASKVGLTVAVRWSAKRTQFGPGGGAEVPLLSYLAQQRRLLIPLAATYGLHFAVRALTERYADRLSAEQGAHKPPDALRAGPAAHDQAAQARAAPAPGDEDGRRIEVEAAGLKAYASNHCVVALQASREACGGQGYLAANRLGRLRSDTDVFTTFEGANTVLLQLVAKGLLSQYKEEMSDLRLWGLVKHLADRAETRLTAMNPIAARRTDREHLREHTFHRAAFEYREQRLLASAGRRLRGLIADGLDSFVAMNRIQDHLLALAEAHVERRIHEEFEHAIARAPSPAASESIATLATLWALSRLEAERGWFLESGYFEPPKARAVRAEVNALCGEVAEHATALVDAFGIPDAVLAAPAGQRG